MIYISEFKDKTYAVKDIKGYYFTGNNKWDKQLRKAKLYHSYKYVKEVCNDDKHYERYPTTVAVEVFDLGGIWEPSIKEKTIGFDVLRRFLMEYFSIGDSDAYHLTRVKSAFSVGTMTLDDFEEFTEETVDDIIEYIQKKLGE